MRKTLYLALALTVILLLVVACGGGSDKEASGGADVAAGEKLYKQAVLGSNAGCSTCHSLDGSVIVGPSFKGLGASMNAAEIREAICNPEAAITEGFPAGVMPANYCDDLSEGDINSLVAFIASLK